MTSFACKVRRLQHRNVFGIRRAGHCKSSRLQSMIEAWDMSHSDFPEVIFCPVARNAFAASSASPFVR